ncbi:hypothetical protein BASA50_009033 [Batrachochytrium salamandrivorans]|uniref:Uncharacterized protein n=1 Tax=Batrachochytrium salamandrivorans TaxID=1357716 RepID=A0ABQ8F2M4_9FUNG|nr:hypothetical protein BASA62_000097 [Batrachochytrium salamandrivorans]KAH6575852.1 hypothetical protein BASA60_004791 [Batrachochytrium salamandrivorans]KAH6578466.1 hypothetical protein BASA61_000224 [Batrachochytrium salamandrivorans]KAH6591032.1 hypothetical protein BASA50_009033 [Batrachochytrium salamandrivorans]KAH9277302.1 hypothetical protein BASA83_000169 [Batrachochytrium salamandrivorans]
MATDEQHAIDEFMAAIAEDKAAPTYHIDSPHSAPRATTLVVTLAAMATLVGISLPFVVSAVNNRIPWVPTTTEKSTVLFSKLTQLWIDTGGAWPSGHHTRPNPICHTPTPIQPHATKGTFAIAGTASPTQAVLKFTDVGSGDGRVVLAAAHWGRHRPSSTTGHSPLIFGKCVGIERNMTLWGWSILAARCWHWLPASRVMFRKQDFWSVDLADSDVVMVFGVPSWMTKFGEKFERELRPGTMVATNKFPIPGWHPLVTDTEISIYRIGMHRRNSKS